MKYTLRENKRFAILKRKYEEVKDYHKLLLLPISKISDDIIKNI
jgi:hypothetical protein